MKWLVFAFIFGIASVASAQSTFIGRPDSKTQFRNIRVCAAGDLQNMASGNDGLGLQDACVPQTGGGCVGEYCVKSPYCTESWRNTGGIILYNMGLSMAGRSRELDYSLIAGPGTDSSHPPANPDHEACDIVILPGDLQDTGDDDSDPPTEGDLAEWRNVNKFLNLLDSSGIPWIASIGNHDSIVMWLRHIDSKMQASPYYHARTSDGLNHALLVPTRAGQQMCLVAVADGASNKTTTTSFITSNVGCGGSHPTIIVSHGLVNMTDLTTTTSCGFGDSTVSNVLDNAGNEEAWLAIGGHWTPTSAPLQLCNDAVNPAAWAGTPKLYLSNVNTQEQDRYNYGNNPIYGNTASDNVGGVYLVIDLDVANDRISFHHWNPYFSTRESISGRYTASTRSEAFDFDARFPP